MKGAARLMEGDCLEVMARMIAEGVKVDSVVTDPPYHLTSIVKRFGALNAAEAKVRATGAYKRHSTGFMGKQWDGGDIAFDPETWRLCFDLLKPGGHLIALGGTRTYHRMACAVEDAGFEIRDMISWLYGSGFPKSHNQHGNWEGWGTALKPACEPAVLARKPLIGTVAKNVQEHGTGALNIDACRVPVSEADARDVGRSINRNIRIDDDGYGMNRTCREKVTSVVRAEGRWPANVIHDGSGEVLAAFPDAPGQQREVNETFAPKTGTAVYGDFGPSPKVVPRGDSGSAARFFYSPKADKSERLSSKHPTIKPIDLMAYFCRLVTPPGGLVLDPFAGSGTTGVACLREGFNCILIEREAEYIADINRRLGHVSGLDGELLGLLA